MEKLIKPFGESQKPVILYMDDIDKIVEIIGQASQKVEISTEDYVIQDLKQLSELKHEFLNELNISIREPYVSLNMKPDIIFLYIGKDDLLSRGLFENIKKILLQNRRPFSWLLQNYIF